MEDRTFELNPLRLHAVTHGDPELPPLVLLHGFMDHAHAWDFVAERLRDRYFVVCLDFRGFGDSGWAPGGQYFFADYQLDVAALWREFKLDAAPVVGHSMGGNVASQWAGLYPKKVSKLVLVEGFGPPARDIEEAPARTAQWVEGLLKRPLEHPRAMLSLEEAAARLLENNPRLPDERADYLARYATKPVAGGFVWKFDPAHRLPSPHPYREDEFAVYWRRIEAPVLALHGADGPLGVEAVMPRYKNIRNLTTAVIEDAAHGIHIEQPERLADTIVRFLKP